MRTVRLTHFQDTLLYRVDLFDGDEICGTRGALTANADLAEGYAQGAAAVLGVEIERVEVP